MTRSNDTMHAPRTIGGRPRRLLAAALALAAGAFVGCRCRIADIGGGYEGNGRRIRAGGRRRLFDGASALPSPPVEDMTIVADPHHRALWGKKQALDPKTVTSKEGDASPPPVDGLPALPPYNHNNVMITSPAFTRELFLLYYEPSEDAFRVYVDERKDKYMHPTWSPVWSRVNAVAPLLAHALRAHFNMRFRGSVGRSAEFMAYFSTGDVPKLSCGCVDPEQRLQKPDVCRNNEFAPILQFGSVYKDPTIVPNVVTMPVWTHLACFREWQTKQTVCEELQLRRDVAGVLASAANEDASASEGKAMPFSTWDGLVPSIIWRGSDYNFLLCSNPLLNPVAWSRDIAPKLGIPPLTNDAWGVVKALRGMWHRLTPRWRAVTLSAMAALVGDNVGGMSEWGKTHHRAKRPEAPWIDAKFTVKAKVHGVASSEAEWYRPFLERGAPVTGEQLTLAQLSKYKYHIDLGGGGGTTWFGTIEKLALPGVLFHHVTATKDYYHDELEPMVHYIPVNEDLSNLKEMYDWAKANSKDAQQISNAATEYSKNRARPEVMQASYEKYFIHSLKTVVDAYEPMKGGDAKIQMENFLSRWSLVGRCSGRDEGCDWKDWKMGATS